MQQSNSSEAETLKSCATHVSQIEGDLQVVPEIVRKLRVHVEHLQDVFPEDLVEVAVGQSPHVGVGFA